MAHATTIGPAQANPAGLGDPQIEYRLTGQVGCGIGDAGPGPERPLLWVGSGLAGLGISPGSELDAAQHDAARAVMNGRDPRTGEQLVEVKLGVPDEAKVLGLPLVEAISRAAQDRGVTPADLWGSARQQDIWKRLSSGVERRPGSYRIAARSAATLMKRVGLDPREVYGDQFVEALSHGRERVPVGNRGYDVTVTFPKSFSVLAALAPAEVSDSIETCLREAALDSLEMLQRYTAYGLRGHHGNGDSAERVDTTGFIGWMTTHRASRAGDPHWHVHFTIANMAQGTDGKWSTIASGGRDLMNHVHLVGAYAEARARELLSSRLGVQFERSQRTGRWEISHVPDELLAVFSRRDTEIRERLAKAGIEWSQASPTERRRAADRTRETKDPTVAGASDQTLTQRWQARVTDHGFDPAAIAAAALAAGRGPGALDAARNPEQQVLADLLLSPDEGMTAHTTAFRRRELMARLCEELPEGIDGVEQMESTAASLLADSEFVAMPKTGNPNFSNADRFTTADLVAAEQQIMQATRDGWDTGLAVVDPATADMALSVFQSSAGYELDAEQAAAYRRLVTGGHGIDAVIGVPGAGKTSIMAAARIAWEADGFVVAGGSTAALAAAHLGNEAGLSQSRSVAYWLTMIQHGSGLTGVDVLILDEAAMTDTRDLAELLEHTTRTGTKIVAIGDPHQLSSPGVGGAFAAMHQLVDGPILTVNRRQRDELERRALEWFRGTDHRGTTPQGRDFRAALTAWADSGRLVTTITPDEAKVATVIDWWDHWNNNTDPYDRIARSLMLAYRNDDVAELNMAGRALARAHGDLTGDDIEFRVHGADPLPLAVGDVVLMRINQYRRGDGPDILNGRRGLITAIDAAAGNVTITWRDAAGELESADVDAAYIARGGLSHGFALTVHKAQGQTVESVSLYSLAVERAILYTGMSRDQIQARTFQPAAELTDDLTLEQWEAMTPEQRRLEVVALMAEKLDWQKPAGMAIEELGFTPEPLAEPEPEAVPAPQPSPQQRHTDTGGRARRDRTRPWLQALGAMPTAPAARHPWLRLAASVSAYRHDYNVQGADPIGPEPADRIQRTDWLELQELLRRQARPAHAPAGRSGAATDLDTEVLTELETGLDELLRRPRPGTRPEEPTTPGADPRTPRPSPPPQQPEHGQDPEQGPRPGPRM